MFQGLCGEDEISPSEFPTNVLITRLDCGTVHPPYHDPPARMLELHIGFSAKHFADKEGRAIVSSRTTVHIASQHRSRNGSCNEMGSPISETLKLHLEWASGFVLGSNICIGGIK